MKREVTADQFEEVRAKLSETDSAIKKVPISAIEVDVESIKHGRILVNGSPVKVNNRFYTKLGSMLNISSTLTRSMIEKGDHGIAAALINGLKDYRTKNSKSTDVILVADIKTKEIVDICPPARYRRVTNDTVLDVTERILNDNPNLMIETIDMNGMGGCSINFLNSEEIGFAQAGKDEFFKFGFSLIQTSRDTLVESYNQRLICSNGLRSSLGEGAIGGNSNISFEDKFRLGGTGTEDIRIFLNKIDDMKKRGFVSPAFNGAVTRATSTKASLSEVEKAFLCATSKLNEIDPELKKQYKSSIARQWFHGYGDAMARITRKGTDPYRLNDKQKQFIKTGMSIWDVVNSLTFLGSNNSGIDFDNKHELKYTAGNLFGKGNKEGYDLEFAQYASL